MSAVLSLGVGFEKLHKLKARIEVRVDNHRAIAFYKRFGMIEADEKEQHRYFEYSLKHYEQDKGRYLALILTGSSDD